MTVIVFLRYMTDTQNEKSINNSLSGIQIGCKDTTFFQTDKIFLLFSIKIHSHNTI